MGDGNSRRKGLVTSLRKPIFGRDLRPGPSVAIVVCVNAPRSNSWTARRPTAGIPLAIYEPKLDRIRWHSSEGAPSGTQAVDDLLAGTRSLPQSAAAALVTAGSKLPGLAWGDRSDDTPPV